MSSYRIISDAGVDMGIYEGATAEEALDAMVRDAGYAGQEEATGVAGPFSGTATKITPVALDVVEVVSALDLTKEHAEVGGQLFSGRIGDHAQSVDVLYVEDEGRAGVAWGADAVWTDCDSAEDAVRRVCLIERVERYGAQS